VYCESFDSELSAAAAYDRAIRHFHPQDAELYVNFKQGMPLPATGGVPDTVFWDGAEVAEDGQV
jgi:hypothetical protein